MQAELVVEHIFWHHFDTIHQVTDNGDSCSY
jgi:hypothetical protein